MGVYVGQFYDSPEFNELYSRKNDDYFRSLFAHQKSRAILHQFFSIDKKECVQVEAHLNADHHAIIELIISECNQKRNGYTKLAKKTKSVYNTPFSS